MIQCPLDRNPTLQVPPHMSPIPNDASLPAYVWITYVHKAGLEKMKNWARQGSNRNGPHVWMFGDKPAIKIYNMITQQPEKLFPTE